jgi:hypothetical protein
MINDKFYLISLDIQRKRHIGGKRDYSPEGAPSHQLQLLKFLHTDHSYLTFIAHLKLFLIQYFLIH